MEKANKIQKVVDAVEHLNEDDLKIVLATVAQNRKRKNPNAEDSSLAPPPSDGHSKVSKNFLIYIK